MSAVGRLRERRVLRVVRRWVATFWGVSFVNAKKRVGIGTVILESLLQSEELSKRRVRRQIFKTQRSLVFGITRRHN